MCPTSCSLIRHSRAAAAVSYDSLLEVGFRSLHEALDTTTPGGRLVFHVFAALAVISSSGIDQACDLGGYVEDGVLDLAA